MTVSYHRAIKVGEVWYTCPSTNNFSVEATSLNPNPTITYTPDESIVYFKEAEEITASQNVASASCSGGTYVNYYAGPTSVTIPLAGNYELETNVASRNANSSLEVYTADGTESVAKIERNGSLGIRTCSFDADAGTMRVGGPYYNDKFQNSLGFDYVLIRLKSVSATVTAAGYATYVPSYDLDFSATSIEAYKVKVSEKGKATLTKVDNVPAGTPVLLYKDGGATENIPVMTGAAAVTDNDLVAGTGATVETIDGEYTNMILNNVGGNIGFYFAAGQTVATNRAYLHFATSLAPEASSRMVMVFGDETTGINDTTRLNNKEEITNIYNLSGQRVAQPTKGLYIVNGKKVIIK